MNRIARNAGPLPRDGRLENDMNCPNCDSAMKPGTVEVHGTLRSLLAFGLSWQALWWHEDAEKPKTLMEPRQPMKAFRCESCQTLVVPTPPAPPPPAIFRRVLNPIAEVFRPRD